jgi:hypothetical protein
MPWATTKHFLLFSTTRRRPLERSDSLSRRPWTGFSASGCAQDVGKSFAGNLSRAGWSCGYISAVDSNGRTIWIVNAHRDDGKRYVVHADEKLTAFLELELAIHEF